MFLVVRGYALGLAVARGVFVLLDYCLVGAFVLFLCFYYCPARATRVRAARMRGYNVWEGVKSGRYAAIGAGMGDGREF